MIKEEIITIDNKEYVKHTTDMERYDEDNNPLPCLIQIETGKMFFDAIDTKPCKFTYIEYEEPKEVEIEA